MKQLRYKLKKVIKDNKIHKTLPYNARKETAYSYLTGSLRKGMPNRRTSTYSEKIKIRKIGLIYENELQYIIYTAGWAWSLQEASQMIIQGSIEVNDKIVKNPKYRVDSGSIIRCLDSRCIIRYYISKYHSKLPLRKYNNKWKYLRYKYMLKEEKIIRLNYNEIVLLNEKI